MKLNRLLLASSAFAGALVTTPALAGDVIGVVVDDTDTVALESANIRVVELNRATTSERDGSFRFPDLPAGTYTLEASYVGAEPQILTVDVPEKGAVRADFALGGVGSAPAILVVGQTANQASALSSKRAGDGVSDVLTRDAVGQFPDQNVAESLRRLPGINVLNDQGEGRFVSVRGLDPELNATSLNGVRVPAPESDVRSVALDVISSELIDSVVVKKSLTPDMDADTIGASIEIKTTSALDRVKPLYKAKLEGSYNDYSGDVTPKGSVDISTRLGDDVGVSAGVSFYQRKFETDNSESEDWGLTDDGVLYAEKLEYRDYDVERKRFNASLGFDFRAGDTTTLFARGIYSQFDDHEYRRRLTFDLGDAADPTGTMTSATFSAADLDADDEEEIVIERDLKDRLESQKIRSIVLGGDTDAGPWKADYSVSWSKSSERENGSIDPAGYARSYESGDDFGVTFDYSDPRFTTYSITSGAAGFNDPSEYEFDKLERTTLSDATDEEWAVKADISRLFAGDGGDFTIQAGGKIRWRTKQYDANIDVFEAADDLTMADGDILGEQTYRLADLGPVIAKKDVWKDFFYANQDLFELDDGDTFEGSNASDYRADEDIYAAYLLGRWDSDTLRVIGGVRMEHTENKLTGYLTDLDEEEVVALNYDRSYTDWLPSLTIRYSPTPDLIFRAAGSKSLVRPKLSNLAPRALVEDEELETGNPELEPYEAWNLDLAAEYYFSSTGGITAGFFYKDVKNYVAEVQREEDGVLGGKEYSQITTFVNGESAEIYGFEASYSQSYTFLPAPFDGLLTQLNYTYTDATGTVFEDGDIGDPRDIPLPSASKHTLNAVLGYEKGPLSLRAAGTYRSKYLDELGGEAEEDRYVDNHFQLDLSAKYRVTPQVQLFAEWINVNNAKYYAYQNFEGGNRLLQYEEYGPTVKFGANVTF
ncbi:TonB-dependent receptor [Altererythrobacter sp. B11]|uniref:TonB-dependent receptor n=1 Tax=Altererythrobacter sp. B11 TaxID=2060312 RepID=UPI000DC718F1|nr:TonB-dependent receptor [Altererythrobacter sp. B11]BBC72032.1 TonB-dependent receptor [Altererythrobacter sp. B11]